jgi:hypothetical protein
MAEEIYYESPDKTWRVRKDWFGEPRIVYPLSVNGKIRPKTLWIGGSWNNFLIFIGFVIILVILLITLGNSIREGHLAINALNTPCMQSCGRFCNISKLNNQGGGNEGDIFDVSADLQRIGEKVSSN